MENLSNEIIESASYSERRLMVYLMCKRGKPGYLLRNPGEEKTLRLEALLSLVKKGVVKIVDFNSKVVYFKFSNTSKFKNISISLGCFI